MKKIPRFLDRLFSPVHLQGLDISALEMSFNNPVVRRIWLYQMYQDLRQMNLDVEKALLHGTRHLDDLSSRRKAYQDILESILRARRAAVEQKQDLNPRIISEVDLDRVTV